MDQKARVMTKINLKDNENNAKGKRKINGIVSRDKKSKQKGRR